jgi:hypothetical protein
MITYELTAAIFAGVILFTLAFLSVSGYVRAGAMGAFDVYGYLHHSIVFLCAPVVSTPLSYFLDHLQHGIIEKHEKKTAFYGNVDRGADIRHDVYGVRNR